MIGVYRTPDERFAWLPDFTFEPRYVEIDGLRRHYLEEGPGDPILLLHGEPTWCFLYRKMIPALRGRFRCVAPDYRSGRVDTGEPARAHQGTRPFSAGGEGAGDRQGNFGVCA